VKICLMGVGNVLMGDDAIGPYVLKSLEAAFDFGPDVTVLDAGTPGLDLTLFLDGFDALVVVDAVQAKGKPGEVRSWRRAELLDKPLPIVMSPHEPTLREALIRLNMMGRCPRDVLLIGVIPARIETGAKLSSEVRRSLPIIEAQIMRELLRLGARPAPRAVPAVPDVWWEAPAA
jgi:hydrogenase maturation protease